MHRGRCQWKGRGVSDKADLMRPRQSEELSDPTCQAHGNKSSGRIGPVIHDVDQSFSAVDVDAALTTDDGAAMEDA